MAKRFIKVTNLKGAFIVVPFLFLQMTITAVVISGIIASSVLATLGVIFFNALLITVELPSVVNELERRRKIEGECRVFSHTGNALICEVGYGRY